MSSSSEIPSDSLGEFLRARRVLRGFSLRGLAEKLDISPAHQSDIEHDRRKPSRDVMSKMAEVLGVAMAELESRDARLPTSTKEWVEKHPELTQLLREVQLSGRPVEDLVVAWKRMRRR